MAESVWLYALRTLSSSTIGGGRVSTISGGWVTGSTPQKSSFNGSEVNKKCRKPYQNSKLKLTAQYFHVTRSFLLKQQLQRINIVKLHPWHATNKSLGHCFVFPYVHILDVVKLSIRRLFDIKIKFFRLVTVHLDYQSGTAVFPW